MKSFLKTPQLSYWEKEVFFKSLDVAIIGSGIVGLSAALCLKEKNPKLTIAIFEKGTIPTGASTKNAGFACFGSISELVADLKEHTESEVLGLVRDRWRGLRRLKERIGAKQMDLEYNGGYELFFEKEEEHFTECYNYIGYFNEKLKVIIGQNDVFKKVDKANKQFQFGKVKHLILNKAEGQLHTGKMMQVLLQKVVDSGIKIFNGVEVQSFEDTSNGVLLQTKLNWKIKAQKILLATNGFTKQLFPKLEVQPARNQVLITKPIPNLKIKGTFHYNTGYYYFRNIDNRILFGGARNLDLKEEMTDEFGTTKLIQETLKQFLKEVILPNTNYEIDFWWSGILGVGKRKKPIVEFVSDRVAVAVRLGGMGVAIGSLIGEQGADLLLKS